MKKTLSLTLAVIALIALLAGCAGAEAPAGTGDAAAADAQPTAAAGEDFDTAAPITVVSREEGSGTRSAFTELVGLEEEQDDGTKLDMTTLDAVTINNTSVMLSTVAGDPYAVGYVSMGSLDDSVEALAVDGTAAGVENVKSGAYPISRPFNIATGAAVSPAAQDFIAFILSDEGQAVVEESGYISLGAAGPYEAAEATGKVVVAGSSSVTPVMEKLKEAYKTLTPGVEVEIQQSDSSTGINAVTEGLCDIGMASRELKDSETEGGLSATVIAQDGIAVIVNPRNPLQDITSEQVKAIYTGEALAWADLA